MPDLDLEAMERRASGIDQRSPYHSLAADVLLLITRVRELEDSYTRGVADERKRCADFMRKRSNELGESITARMVANIYLEEADAIERGSDDGASHDKP